MSGGRPVRLVMVTGQRTTNTPEQERELRSVMNGAQDFVLDLLRAAGCVCRAPRMVRTRRERGFGCARCATVVNTTEVVLDTFTREWRWSE